MAIKGRDSRGNLLTRHMVHKIQQKEVGASTLGAIPIWYDETVRRLNGDGRGRYLGRFSGDDRILAILKTGQYQLFPFALSTHFPDEALTVVKWIPGTIVSAVYWDGEKERHNVKRFEIEPSREPVLFITEHPKSRLTLHSLTKSPRIKVSFDQRSSPRKDEVSHVDRLIDTKGPKAIGNRLTPHKVKEIELLDPVFEPMTAEAEELQMMIITDKEVGKLGSPEEQGLEDSPMSEFRQQALIVPDTLQADRIEVLNDAPKPKSKKKPAQEKTPEGYKPGKQITLDLG